MIRTKLFLLFFLPFISLAQPPNTEDQPGITLSVHTYSFRSFTLAESMKMAQEAGVRYLEVYPEQPLGSGLAADFGPHMTSDQQLAVKSMLEQHGLSIQAMGVANAKNASEWRALFAFCKEMGIQYLVVEPDVTMLAEVGRLATEFEIYTAIHNHPQPSYYWSPEVVLESIAIANSAYVGACADVGHWVRSGLDPVHSLKTLAGKVMTLHFKDLHQAIPSGSDVIIGEGVLDMKGIIQELSRQGFRGNFSVEYEDDPSTNLHQVRQSIHNLRMLLGKNNGE